MTVGAAIWWPAWEAWVRLCDRYWRVMRKRTDDEA